MTFDHGVREHEAQVKGCGHRYPARKRGATSAMVTVSLAALLSSTGAAPADEATLRELLQNESRFSTFAALAESADLDGLETATVFAPTNEAFDRLPAALVEEMQGTQHEEAADQIVKLHIVPSGPHDADDIPVEMQTFAEGEGLGRLVTTYSRGELTLQVPPPKGTENLTDLLRARAANETRVVSGNVAEQDGIIVHAIDRVLLPPGFDPTAFVDDDQPSDQVASADDASTGAARQSDGGTADVSAADTSPADDGTGEDFASEIVASDRGPTPAAPGGDAEMRSSETDLPGSDSDTSRLDGDAADASEMADSSSTVTIAPPEDPSRQGDQGQRNIDGIVATDTTPGDSRRDADMTTVTSASDDTRTEQDVASADGSQTPDDTDSPGVPDVGLTREIVSTADLIGQSAMDGEGNEIGTISDVLVTLEDARVRTVVLETSDGFLGFGDEETRRVPVAQIVIDPLDGSVVVEDSGSDDAE